MTWAADVFRAGDRWYLVDRAEDNQGDEFDCALVEILENGVDVDGDVRVLVPDWSDCSCYSDDDDCDCDFDVTTYFKPHMFSRPNSGAFSRREGGTPAPPVASAPASEGNLAALILSL